METKLKSKSKSKSIIQKSKSIIKKDKNKAHYAYNKINEEYNPKLLNTFDPHVYFPQEDLNKLNKNNIQKLQMTNIGTYSISKPIDADWITNTILHHYHHIYSLYHQNNQNKKNKELTIIDGTAGLGGNLISFAKKFDKVIGIEYNKVHYEVCKNNVELFKYKNVEIYNDSILNYYKKYDIKKSGSQTIFFFDPPWGGKSYKKQKYVKLGIGGVDSTIFLNQLHSEGYKYIVLKAPRNFIISDIILNTKYKNIHVQNYYNMILLFIF
jgi:16S rRNA G966 N2-methylase RsmD